MKKYLLIIPFVAFLALGVWGASSVAHAAGKIQFKPITTTSLTSQTVGTLNGNEIETDTYSNGKVRIFVVSKAYYTAKNTKLNAQIVKLQAQVTENNTLSAQLAS